MSVSKSIRILSLTLFLSLSFRALAIWGNSLAIEYKLGCPSPVAFFFFCPYLTSGSVRGRQVSRGPVIGENLDETDSPLLLFRISLAHLSSTSIAADCLVLIFQKSPWILPPPTPPGRGVMFVPK